MNLNHPSGSLKPRPVPPPYVALGLTTTGSDPDTSDILEIGAVIDLSPKTLLDNCPIFHCYVVHGKFIYGDCEGLAKSVHILNRIVNREAGAVYLKPESVVPQLGCWLNNHGFYPRDRNLPVISVSQTALKLRFLAHLPSWDQIKVSLDLLDVASLYWSSRDGCIEAPTRSECIMRACLSPKVANTAIEDAKIAVQLFRNASLW